MAVVAAVAVAEVAAAVEVATSSSAVGVDSR
jgi:hypothetical protein